MNKLPKDIVQHLSQYIEETPEEWDVFKQVFDNSTQATMMKKVEVLSRPIWVEIHMDYNSVVKVILQKDKPTFCIMVGGDQ